MIFAGAGRAASPLYSYDLAVADYRLGMSFDEVADVRSYQSIVSGEPGHFVVHVGTLQVSDIPLRLKVCFKNERVYKVIAHLPPDQFDALALQSRDVFGDPRAFTTHYLSKDLVEVEGTVFQWDFPNAFLSLAKNSYNTEFATLGLVTLENNSPSVGLPN